MWKRFARVVLILLLSVAIAIGMLILCKAVFDASDLLATIFAFATFILIISLFVFGRNKKPAAEKYTLAGNYAAKFKWAFERSYDNHCVCSEEARHRARRRTFINISSGFLALLSGILSLIPQYAQQYVEAGLALCSGTFNLVLNLLYEEEKTQKLAEGAGAFLELHKSARRYGDKKFDTDGAAQEAFDQIEDEFFKAYTEYQHYVTLKSLR
jgi:hypothetical protein